MTSLPCEAALTSAPVQAVADALFGGCGYVPDVTALQAWLECAWAAGFDPMGAEQLGGCASTAPCMASLRSSSALCWPNKCSCSFVKPVCPCQTVPGQLKVQWG